MINDNENIISEKTWSRAVDPIKKLGYMDGASDGQTKTFQSSFDIGYKLGIEFGLELGSREALFRLQKNMIAKEPHHSDQRKINCQICMDNTIMQKNTVDQLCNKQKEENDMITNFIQSNDITINNT